MNFKYCFRYKINSTFSFQWLSLTICLAILLSSCGTPPAIPVSTFTPTQQNIAAPLATPKGPSMFETGLQYADAPGDAEIDFLDILSFQTTVSPSTESLDIVIHMRDLPLTLEYEKLENITDISWAFYIFLDSSATEFPGDYYIVLNPNSTNLAAMMDTGTKANGDSATIPIDSLWESKSVYNSNGIPRFTSKVVADADANTLTITARVPNITPRAMLSFGTTYNSKVIDRPDNYIPPELMNLATSIPETFPTPNQTDQVRLIPVGAVHAYPGPAHYEGDVLTLEIPNFDGIPGSEQKASLQLDQLEPFEVTGKWSDSNVLILPLAFNTRGLTGNHTLQITTSDSIVNETYHFEVLSADQRPTNEANAVWQVYETQCCTFHYLSGTAAARDIEFIAGHFQKGAEDLSTFVGGEINSELNVYLVDRIWGNGGFGQNGLIVASYTDRYYGPTVGGVGLETLARHELSHATGIGLENAGDGINFSYEGLAVYVASGHYKPESLVERGAALYDLGYFTPIEEFIGQHELDYLQAASVLVYIEKVYGQDAVWKFLSADDDKSDGQPSTLEFAIQSTFGISLEEFNTGFRTWLESNDPGTQLYDLRLTIKLQDLRREYQDTYSPPPFVILGNIQETILQPAYVPLIIREPNGLPNVTFELIAANAQKAIVEGDYSLAEQLTKVLENILETETFKDPLAEKYFHIAQFLMDQGFNVDEVTLYSGNTAQVLVTRNTLDQQSLQLQESSNGWDIIP